MPHVFDSPLFPVIIQLAGHGFEFRILPDTQVLVRPIHRVPPHARKLMRQYPGDLRLLVTMATDPAVAERRDAFHEQVETIPAPPFLFRANVPYVPGRCFSCGDAFPALHFGRCWRCSVAWRLVCDLPISKNVAAAIDTAKVIA